jgi:hypothetical protein
MNCSLVGEMAVRESVSPGIELGHCFGQDVTWNLHAKLYDLFFKKQVVFTKVQCGDNRARTLISGAHVPVRNY